MKDKRLKAKWCKALVSGKYKQGQLMLHYVTVDYASKDTSKTVAKEKWCCLGVLCDIVDPKKWEGQMPLSTAGSYSFVYKTRSEICPTTLPIRLRKKLGISSQEEQTLTYMNDGADSKQRSFKQIAKWIKENL